MPLDPVMVAALPIDGLKIHPLYIMDYTPLGEMYKRGEFQPMPLDKYVKLAADIIEMMPPQMVIMRFTAEGHDDKLLAPEYCRPSWKNRVRQMVEEELLRRGTKQGSRNPFFHHYGV